MTYNPKCRITPEKGGIRPSFALFANKGYKMNSKVKTVTPGSVASKTKIAPGDILRKINGKIVSDVLDYKFLSYDAQLLLELLASDGRIKLVKIKKPEGADLGLEFESYLMDKQRSCSNKCIFCFIDQLPAGLRKTLYYKDDDVRLSFLQGNYITLTNLSQHDINRIIKMRISPINVSVHTLDPKLRAQMLGIKEGHSGVRKLEALVAAGITLNCQIVCCPGINDGAELSHTIENLIRLGSSINSVSIVPVGLTKHRDGLAPLRPFDKKLALETVRQVNRYAEICLRTRGSRVFFCADELYIKAGLDLPPDSYYEDYPQLENGVGMMCLFIEEFMGAFRNLEMGETEKHSKDRTQFSIATGKAAAKYLTNLLKIVTKKYDTIDGAVYAIRNEFFGDSVTVSGLVTGGDIIASLKGRTLGSRLLIPRNMLKDGEDIFLDDVKVAEVSDKLGVPVQVVRQSGGDFLNAILFQ